MQPIRAWSRDKLNLLGKYLGAYATIMKPQKGISSIGQGRTGEGCGVAG